MESAGPLISMNYRARLKVTGGGMNKQIEPTPEQVRAGVEALEGAGNLSSEELVRFILRAAMSAPEPENA